MYKNILLLVLFVSLSHAQQNPPPPCGLKGLPENVPCWDEKSGKIIHTESANPVPSTPLTERQKALLNGTAPEPKPVEIPKFKVPKNKPSEERQQVHFPNAPQQVPEPAPVYVKPPVQETDPNVERQGQNYQTGYTIGRGLGAAIYNARLKHAINKACFDRGAEGWRLPSGQIIKCSDWKMAHPNHR